ncbi:hypothetical protein WJX73_010201 [Symbiochloris irregularis]|uniref:C2 NT-type domain-containing protein n=1 Tax=Symbiochloris irregularis TaxID=706552 RepID=A0AAW1PCP6_9CHLO
MFKKLARGSKAPVKFTVEITITSLERLPIQHGKVKVAWGRGLERSGHWHETALAPVQKGSASINSKLSQTMTFYKDSKGNLDSKDYELKVLLVDPAAVNPKPVTVATGDLNMAIFAAAPGIKRAETVFLALRENGMWNVLSGDVLLRASVVCLDEGLDGSGARDTEVEAADDVSIASEEGGQSAATAEADEDAARSALFAKPASKREQDQSPQHQQPKAAAPPLAPVLEPEADPGLKSQWSAAAAAMDLNLDAEEKIVELREERDSLQARVDELRAGAAASTQLHQQQINKLKSRVAELEAHKDEADRREIADTGAKREQDLELANAQIRDLQVQLQAAKLKAEQASSDEDSDAEDGGALAEAQSKLLLARTQILELEEKLENASRAPRALKASDSAKDLARRNADLVDQVAELQQQLADQREEADRRLAVLEGRVEAEDNERMSRSLSQDLGLSASRVHVIQVETMRSSLEKERATAKHQVTSLEVELEQMEAELEAEKASARDKIRELTEAQQAAEEKNGVLEAHLAQLIAQAQGGKTSAQGSDLQMMAATQAEKLKDAEYQLDRMGSELMNVRAAAREQELGTAKLQQQLAAEHEARRKADWLEAEVGRLEAALAAEKARTNDNRANLEAQVEALQAAVPAPMRSVSMSDAFTFTSPRVSDVAVPTVLVPDHEHAHALSAEEFMEQPRAIALQSQLSILRRTVDVLNKSSDATEQAHALQLQEEHQQSQQRIVALEAQLASLPESPFPRTPSATGTDPALVAEMEQQMIHAMEELQQLAQELQEARQQAARAEAHRDDVLRALQDSTDHSSQERDLLQRELSGLQEALQALHEEQAGWKEHRAASQARIAELEDRINLQADELSVKSAPGRNGLLSPPAQPDALLRELAEVGRQLELRDKRVAQLEQELLRSQQASADATAAKESLETELQSARAATEDLISKFDEAQSLSGIVAGEVERLTEQLADARAENEALSHQTGTRQPKGDSALEQENEQLSEDLAQAQHDKLALLNQIEALQRDGTQGRDLKLAAEAQAQEQLAQHKQQLADLEARALTELNGMHDELLEMREAMHKLQAALEDSEGHRERLSLDKTAIEGQLHVASGNLQEVERSLASVSSSASSHASYRTTHSQWHALHNTLAHGHDHSVHEVAAVDAVMLELVSKKMELAELHEQHLKQGRELRWAQQQAVATEAKLSKLEAIIFSKAAGPKPPTTNDLGPVVSGLIPATHT